MSASTTPKGSLIDAHCGKGTGMAIEKHRAGLGGRKCCAIKTDSKQEEIKMEEKAKKDASMICQLIEIFNAEKSKSALSFLITVLMQAQVSVPMTVSMEDMDVQKFLHAKAGDTVTTSGAIRMKPDMLKNSAGELFFPAFTLKEETPEDYRKSFSWITMDFMNCVRSSYHNETCAGIVINGFSDPFVVDRQLLKFMIDMEASRDKKPDAE